MKYKEKVAPHGRVPHYIPGNHWVVCDRCGLTYRNKHMRVEWTGAVVCGPCWEPRHEQDFVRPGPDITTARGHIRPNQVVIDPVENIGDNDVTLTVGTDSPLQIMSEPLSNNRTITLATAGASNGDTFTIQKLRRDPFTVDVGGLYTIKFMTSEIVKVTFNGAAWELTRADIL